MVRCCSLLAAAVAAAAAAGVAGAWGPPTTLFKAYEGDPRCYRQPLLVAVPPSTVLAFVEGRNNISWCSGTDWPATIDFPILLRRSTDAGATFAAAQEITRGNLDFLVAAYAPATRTVYLALQLGDTDTLLTVSADAGLTWSTPTKIYFPGAGAYNSVIPGVGHGIVVSAEHCMDPTCGGTVGRILLPFVVSSRVVSNDTSCGDCQSGIVFSDDGGATWQIGAVSAQAGSREASLVQLRSDAYGTTGAVIYATERNLGNATGSRLHAVSLNGGRTFAAYGRDDGLPDAVTANWTGLVSGAARYAPAGSPAGVIVFTAPASRTERANMSVWVSKVRACAHACVRVRSRGGGRAGGCALQPAPHVKRAFSPDSARRRMRPGLGAPRPRCCGASRRRTATLSR